MSERFEPNRGEEGMEEELSSIFAVAESGMTDIASEVEVEDIDELARETGLSREHLEQFRVLE
jgi:hypothetical protein